MGFPVCLQFVLSRLKFVARHGYKVELKFILQLFQQLQILQNNSLCNQFCISVFMAYDSAFPMELTTEALTVVLRTFQKYPCLFIPGIMLDYSTLMHSVSQLNQMRWEGFKSQFALRLSLNETIRHASQTHLPNSLFFQRHCQTLLASNDSSLAFFKLPLVEKNTFLQLQ